MLAAAAMLAVGSLYWRRLLCWRLAVILASDRYVGGWFAILAAAAAGAAECFVEVFEMDFDMAIFRIDYDALWVSIRKWSRKAGRAATRPVLLMWYVMRSKSTPRADKWAIFGSLAYLILPVDFLDAKRLPVIGWLDEVASLAVLVQKMSKYITPDMEKKADAQLDKWFPVESCYAEYELIEN